MLMIVKFMFLLTLTSQIMMLSIPLSNVLSIFSHGTVMLKSNPGKTDLLHLTLQFTKQPSLGETITFAGANINIKNKAINLIICRLVPTSMKFVKKLLSCNEMNKTHSEVSLIHDGLKMLANALVISWLDYCNSVLYGIPKYQRDKLKRIQNTAARLVMNSKHLNQATRLLKNLHWLPVETGIEFKIFLLTYKTINGQSAGYLKPSDQGHVHYFVLKELELTTMVVELFQLQRLNGGMSYQRT